MIRTMIALTLMAIATTASAGDALKVYGPGGPAPAMKAVIAAYQQKTGQNVTLDFGPLGNWKDQAMTDAGVIYSGSENMLTAFSSALPDLFEIDQAKPVYLRPAAILVRKGNPKGITGLADLLKPGIKVLAVSGAGQTGLWEDIAGRQGDIETLQALRRNIHFPEAANSAVARDLWQQDETLDAWLIWNTWQIASPDLADLVEIEPEYAIYRPVSVVATHRGGQEAADFITYLGSDEASEIFAKYGWSR